MTELTTGYRLPVKDIFIEAINLPITHFKSLFRIAVPLLVYIATVTVLILAWSLISGKSLTFSGSEHSWIFLPFISLAIVGAVLLLSAIVSSYRLFLLGETCLAARNMGFWNGTEFSFLWRFFLLALGALAVSILIMVITVVGIKILPLPFEDYANIKLSILSGSFTYVKFNDGESSNVQAIASIVASLPIFYAAARWSLTLPAATVSDCRGQTFARVWALSSGNALRVMLVAGIFPFLASYLLKSITATGVPFSGLINSAIGVFAGIVMIGFISLCYKYLAQNVVLNGDSHGGITRLEILAFAATMVLLLALVVYSGDRDKVASSESSDISISFNSSSGGDKKSAKTSLSFLGESAVEISCSESESGICYTLVQFSNCNSDAGGAGGLCSTIKEHQALAVGGKTEISIEDRSISFCVQAEPFDDGNRCDPGKTKISSRSLISSKDGSSP